jgi:hypothetical protein
MRYNGSDVVTLDYFLQRIINDGYKETAVFFIKYLRSLGFDAENDLFANNSWYFRNALVRARVRAYSSDMPYLLYASVLPLQ